MNGITYYRLKSDYAGDTTKNCALNGIEVDNNFYYLEGKDIKNVAVEDKDIVITLQNGDKVSAHGVLDFIKPEDIKTSVEKIEFDKVNCIWTITYTDGTTQTIDTFIEPEESKPDFRISTDNTLQGEGLTKSPLCISPAAKTGQYRAVKAIIDTTKGEELPVCNNILGDRYVTCENISDYGYLYDYRAVHEIACELKNTEWRIPTKNDWDDLLNTIEPCECGKEHDKADKNKFLGKWAGALLKSKTMWKECDCNNECGCNTECDCDRCSKKCECESNCDNTCFDYTNDPCKGTNESESTCKCKKDHCEHNGMDAYGFRITPAGYADDGCNFSYFKERSAFWTATTDTNSTKAYIKRFQYNKNNVYQDVIPSNYHLSLRLVKDYDGKNYYGVEEIMDMEYPTLLLPSATKGKTIWTSCNFACDNDVLRPMTPNDGQGITFTTHYFINEWNGFKWVRNEIKQGESVVVAKASGNKKMVEYRVVGNQFINVNEMVFSDVMEEVTPILDGIKESVETEKEQRIEGDTQIWDALTQEIERSQQVESEIWEAIEKEAEARESVDKEQWTAIESETSARESVEKQLWTAIGSESQIREEEDKKIYEGLNKETEDRISVDNQQWDVINEEIEERKKKDEEIEGKLIVQEGTEYNPNTGELTLKSSSGENDIKVQFSFNFGEF